MKTYTKSHLRLLDRFINIIESASSSDRLLLRLGLFAVIVSGIWLVFSVNDSYVELTPTTGGTIREGVIGTPRFANPALAITRADQDISALVYSGLMKIGNDGNLENDLAEEITISEDGLTYSVKLRKDVVFHDKTPLTARDVIFTIQLIQDPDLKSPLRGNWTDVSVEEINEYEFNIVLAEAYAPFIENFTLGVMPAHIWSNLPIEQLPFSQLNTEPIGSGPFSIIAAKRDSTGLINYYNLSAFRENQTKPKIDTIELYFYQNEEELLTALESKEIDATAYVSTQNIEDVLKNKNLKLISLPLPRVFGIFFNQNKSTALLDKSVREALTVAINRDQLIDKSLSGYGIPIDSSTIYLSSELESLEGTDELATTSVAKSATEILESAGWKLGDSGVYEKTINKETVPLSITLRTSNSPLFQSLIENIAKQWQEIGVNVITEQFEQSGLIQSVIRPRDYQALLFGLDMNRSYDLYPFWHSSQQDDPGLNVAQYANVQVDQLLETARIEQDNEIRKQTLVEASQIISEEKPAVLLFQPSFTYVVSKEVTIPEITRPGSPSDRFSNISEWHTESESLWPVFRKDI